MNASSLWRRSRVPGESGTPRQSWVFPEPIA
jgi:hypothetical protein